MKSSSHILRIAHIEWIKHRKTPFLWVILGIPLMIGLIQLILKIKLSPDTAFTSTPWPDFILSSLNLFSFLLLPLAVILLTSQIMQLEYKSNNWKQLFIMPFPKWEIIVGKFLFALLVLVALYLVFLMAIPLAGTLVGWIKPSTGFQNFSIAWTEFFTLAGQSYCAILGLLSIQFLLAFVFSNYTYPIIAGVAASVVFSTVATAWSKSIFIPYAFPILHIYLLREQLNPPYWFGIAAFYWVSLIATFTCLTILLLSLRFRRSPF